MGRTDRSPQVRESETIFDSGFQSLGSRFLSLELGFRIPIVTGIPDSLSCIPDSKAQNSRFQKQKFLWFRNPNSLSWNETEFFFLVCLFLTQINWCPLSPTSPFFITIAILLGILSRKVGQPATNCKRRFFNGFWSRNMSSITYQKSPKIRVGEVDEKRVF